MHGRSRVTIDPGVCKGEEGAAAAKESERETVRVACRVLPWVLLCRLPLFLFFCRCMGLSGQLLIFWRLALS